MKIRPGKVEVELGSLEELERGIQGSSPGPGLEEGWVEEG